MRAIFCSLLSASLLIHALFGCCWHDLHNAGACGETPISLATEPACDHDHDHDAAPDGHGSHCPCKGQSHCHGLCNYLPAQKTHIGKSQVNVLIDFAVDAQATSGSHVAAASFAPGMCKFCPAPPMRLHLLHQILLI